MPHHAIFTRVIERLAESIALGSPGEERFPLSNNIEAIALKDLALELHRLSDT